MRFSVKARHARSRTDVWFATHAEVAAWAKEHAA
jgi:hypothetical protein